MQLNDQHKESVESSYWGYYLKIDLFFSSKMMRLENVNIKRAAIDVLNIGVNSKEKATLLNRLFTLLRSSCKE